MFSKNPSASGIPFDNTSNGFIAMDAQNAIEEARNVTLNQSVTATANATTTSGTNSVISGMTLTPVAGTYLVLYSGTIGTSDVNNSGEVSIYTGATQVTHTVRVTGINVALLLGLIGTSTVNEGAGQTQAVVTVDGATAISVQFRRTVGSGTITVGQRSMIILRVG